MGILLSTNLGMGITLWAGAVILGFRHKLKAAWAHFLPQGTPISLIPMLIIMETISLFIQPMALAVRLTATITFVILALITILELADPSLRIYMTSSEP